MSVYIHKRVEYTVTFSTVSTDCNLGRDGVVYPSSVVGGLRSGDEMQQCGFGGGGCDAGVGVGGMVE